MEAWRDELYHHGIRGMKWGVRNGPPYPISKSSKIKNKFTKSIQDKILTKVYAGEKLDFVKRSSPDLTKIVKVTTSKKKIKLPSSTYAKVVSSILSNMTKHQRYEETYFTKSVGNYRYLVKNNFDGTIDILGRTKIPDSTTKLFKRKK